MGKTALVLGNGESRLNIDLKKFPHDVLIGCNAIHRDLKVDHLICCDKRTAQEAFDAGVKNLYTREQWAEQFNSFPLPELPYTGQSRIDQPKHWGSGGYAVLLATKMAENIVLLGFDLYGISTYTKPGSVTVRVHDTPKVNNIYKGTANYSSADTSAVDHSYWVYQLSKIFEIFHKHSITIINKADWAMPTEWQKDNVKFVAL